MPVYVSDLLTATAAPVSAAPTSTRTFQWLRGSTAISGATSSTYTAVTDDIGATIAASQIETNVAGTATATSAPTEVIQAFDPIRLFSASEPGVWYDPGDISTLFKEPAGVNPVTAPGDNVGLMLDKSRGLVLGPELVLNGTFDSGIADWVSGSGAVLSWDSGRLSVQNTTTSTNRRAYQAFSTTIGTTYQLSATIVGAESGRINIGTSAVATEIYQTAFLPAGSYTYVFTATTTTSYIGLATGSLVTTLFDNISVKELPGNHATQSITASQPIYGIVPAGGRRNIVLWSEDFRNTAAAGSSRPWSWQDVTVVADNILAPDGTLTADKVVEGTTSTYHVAYQYIASIAATSVTFTVYAKAAERSWLLLSAFVGADALCYFDLSGAGATGTMGAGCTGTITAVGTDGWYRCSVTRTVTAGTYTIGPAAGPTTGNNSGPYTGNGTSGVYLWGWQVETNATATPYQRVTTQYDVTEAGVASLGYLYFDGSGDFMSTGTITPGTDKVQVFTGVRKLSDAATGTIVELSANTETNNGSFHITAPNVFLGHPYWSQLRGTDRLYTTTGFGSLPAPRSDVLSFLYDIAGAAAADELKARVSGVPASLSYSVPNAGTGDFLAYPLYLGRRNGTDLPFNGHIHSLIVRFGPNLTAARISATESWVASKTAGVVLP